MAARLLHGRFFCSRVPNFDQNPGNSPIVAPDLRYFGVPNSGALPCPRHFDRGRPDDLAGQGRVLTARMYSIDMQMV
ncbi:hypothetical protein TNCV_1715071 [Trichonephila clavipes]|nr:hypothetical protein TNCV_1715071 [Trichonephila clavipes]